ncbi:MAG TPA: hypothetical protein VF666_16850 [Pyrinomonadaceae bacterium]
MIRKVNIKTFSSLALFALVAIFCHHPTASAQDRLFDPLTTAQATEKRTDAAPLQSTTPHPSSASPRSTDMTARMVDDAAARTTDETARVVDESRWLRPESVSLSFRRESWNTGASLAPQTGNARTPLTPGEKMKFAAKSGFISPQAFIFPAVTAIITQWGEDSQPHKTTEDEVADGLSRFAINYGKRSSKVFLSNGVFASLFKQDPRYRPSEKKGFGARAAHAVSRVFVTDSDEGKLQPNYSRFAGSFTSSALANLYERSTPGHDRIGTDATLRRFAKGFITDALTNLIFREFWPDIRGIF